MSQRILVIEDEVDILDLVEHVLSRDGFRVIRALDGEGGMRLAREKNPDLIVLDLMLPGVSGLDVCRSLKGDPLTRETPIVMLTAKSEETDIVIGLGLGADDYITKPFSPRELVARVAAVLRRSARRRTEATASERLVIGPLVIDSMRHEATVDDAELGLTATEFRMLQFLASQPGRVFTREQIAGYTNTGGVVTTDRNVDAHVKSVRKKLGTHRDLIETVRGIGYRFSDSFKHSS